MPVSKIRKKKLSRHEATVAATAQTPVHIGPKPWLAPLMVALLVLGLLWIVVFYLTAGTDVKIPLMSSMSNLANVAIGFGFIGVGFALSTRWR